MSTLKLGNGVADIQYFAFYGCSSLTNITFGSQIALIGEYAFGGCNTLENLIIPDSVTEISAYAFALCNKLNSITLPATLTTIGDFAFQSSSLLKNVFYTGNRSQKEKIQIGRYNEYLTNATWYCDYVPLAITNQPKSVGVDVGKTAKITVSATGEGLTYKWYYKKPGAKKFYASSSFTKGTYYVKDMDTSKSGRQVYCVITDSCGNSVTTDTVTLDVKVTITRQPVSVGVESGSAAKVSIKAVGKGLTYTWYYKKPGAKNFYKSTTKKSTYSITMSDSNDGRQVYCVITDSYGNTVTSETVTLNKAVTISTQPKSVSVSKGKTAKVTVSATGTGLVYKWYYKKPGAKKFYASSTFTKGTYYIKNIDAAKSGRQVYCVITDAYGNSVKTNTVTLKMK